MARAAARAPPRPRRARPRPTGEDLFSAWRLFFERLAEQGPVVLVFEDLQWADAGLLDFVEYLLEWSRNHPLFVLALARPGAGRTPARLRRERPQRNDALARAALRRRRWRQLLDGFVPGLPGELRGADPRPGRGRPAVRGRDGADAARPRPARPRGRRVPADRARSRRSTCPRRCTRSSPPDSTASTPDERRLLQDAVGARQDVHARPASRRCPGLAEPELEPLAHIARPQGGALRPGRPALAGARPVRLPPGPAEARRVRDAREARAQDSASRRRRAPRAGLRCRRAGDRRGGRRPLPRRLPGGARRRRRGRRSRPGRRRCSPVQASARRRWRRTTRRSATSSRRPSSADDPIVEARLHERAGATAWAVRSGGRGSRSLRACARAVRGGGVDASGGAGHGSARRGRVAAQDIWKRR